MNVQFDYLYRDAGNNKQSGALIFSGEKVEKLEYVDEAIQRHLIDDMFFIARDVGVPPLSFHDYDVNLDHDWHEYLGLSWTDMPATVGSDFDINNFIKLMSDSKKYQDRLFGRKT